MGLKRERRGVQPTYPRRVVFRSTIPSGPVLQPYPPLPRPASFLLFVSLRPNRTRYGKASILLTPGLCTSLDGRRCLDPSTSISSRSETPGGGSEDYVRVGVPRSSRASSGRGVRGPEGGKRREGSDESRGWEGGRQTESTRRGPEESSSDTGERRHTKG